MFLARRAEPIRGARQLPDEPSAHADDDADDEAPAPRRATRLFVLASVLVGAWAVFQNFYKIGTAPALGDEPTYVQSGWQYVHGTAHTPTTSGTNLISAPGNFEHPPLAKYLFGLAQLIGGGADDLTASRCVSALATVLAGALVAWWIGRTAGRWAGLLAGGLLTLLPEAASGSIGSFNRFADLDPVASAFMVLSVVLAWEWARRTGRPSWRFAAYTGAAVGLAAGSKENGFLGAIGPVLLTVLFAVFTRPRDRRAILVRIGQAGAAVLAAVLVFVALYLPLGSPVTDIRYLIDFQSAQSSVGHSIGFAGRVTSTPPWWTNLWYAGHSWGSLLTGFLLAAAVLAVVLRRDRLVGWCAAALAAPFVFHCFIANVALGYYWVMWTPMFLTLAALGTVETVKSIAKAVRRISVRMVVPVAIVTSLAVLAIPVGESFSESSTVADIQPNGVQVLPSLMQQYHLSGAIVSTGLGSWEFAYYVPSTKIYTTVPKTTTDTAATSAVADASLIVISTVQCRDPLDPTVRALAKINVANGHADQIYADSSVTVYRAIGSLTLPTRAETAAEPISRPVDGC